MESQQSKRMKSKDAPGIGQQLVQMAKSKWFWKQIGITVIASLLLVLGIFLWLKLYTHHGQQLTLPDYTGMDLELARKDASRKSFDLVVDDSVHMVGRKGGEILSQNPEGNSKVKENRKIYVTVAKYQPDMILSANLPVLYGKNFENKREELSVGYELKLEVVGYKFDPGPVDHILEVMYKGEPFINSKGRNNALEIEKGAILQVILSQSTGAVITVPNVVCEELDQARFKIESMRLSVAEVVSSGNDEEDLMYVYKQIPSYDPERTMVEGEGITLYVQSGRPDSCR